ncbi:hypothetical protein LCGC14_1283450 [marine sediment metagenome]|uniref:YqaJ viral recombinase domain-containing protein n=1 Tax=marine sediment metagenome TaxID=412755 RepID=A0A0F9NXN0_9ZZZZ
MITGSEEWHEWRKAGIGGSDASVICGQSPFSTPYDLWRIKVGLDGPPVTNAAMNRGNVYEDFVRRIYILEAGRYVALCEPMIWNDCDYIRANIDGMMYKSQNDIGEGDNPGVLEIKCPGPGVIAQIEREGLPDYYTIQMQHYLMVTGYSWGSFAIWDSLWARLLPVFDIQEDKELQELILEKEQEFWGFVQRNEAPPQTMEGAFPDLPKIGGDDKFLNVESVALPKDERENWQRLITAFSEGRALKTEAELMEDVAKGEIKDAMGDADKEIIEGFGYRIHYKDQAGRKSLDKPALLRAHPDVNLDDFQKIGKPSKPFRPYPIKQRGGK